MKDIPMKTTTLSIAALWLACSGAQADLNLRFIEGAPKDRFEITSTADCLDGPVSIELNLAPSAGALIFDVTEQGGGVDVFQPFELVAGGDLVSASSDVKDGDQILTLTLSQLPKDRPVSFTIDVDDTVSARQITVNGSEIEGAEVRMTWMGATQSGVFGANARAVIFGNVCAS